MIVPPVDGLHALKQQFPKQLGDGGGALRGLPPELRVLVAR
jgi:hypothetical protein